MNNSGYRIHTNNSGNSKMLSILDGNGSHKQTLGDTQLHQMERVLDTEHVWS